MYRLLLYSIITSLAFSANDVRFTDGQSRCTLRECMCEVRPSPPSNSHREEGLSRRLSVYFEEGSHQVRESDKIRIRNFFSSNGRVAYSVIGYTDGCGTTGDNNLLASNRAKEIRHFAPSGVVPRLISGGEVSSGHSGEARRVDIIAQSSRMVTREIEKVPADFYLIDASGSMWNGHARWSDVVSASVKPNSRIFLSMVSGCRNNQTIGSVIPRGGTEIWYSYWKLLEKMAPGQTLLVVSDFESTYPLTQRERSFILQRVRERGVLVRTIQL